MPRTERHAPTRRALLVIELLAPLRNGATTDELTSDVSEFTGENWSRRTLLRDLKVLEVWGVISRQPNTRGTIVWTWRGDSAKAAALLEAANRASSTTP